MLRRIASYLKGYERFAAASPLLVVLETGCELTIPLLMARIINQGIYGESLPVILQSGALMVLVALVATFAGGRRRNAPPPPPRAWGPICAAPSSTRSPPSPSPTSTGSPPPP